LIKKDNYMTPAGFRALADELEQLLKIERPKVTELVQWAASNGDRSENADYLYGKKRLREIDRRVRFLSSRLDRALVVDPLSIKSKEIKFGATVDLQDEEGQKRKVSIVGIDEVDTSRGHLSWQSPMGRALLNKSVGEEAVVVTPQGEIIYEILQVTYRSLEK
jgi:transcription elongation factor GreB